MRLRGLFDPLPPKERRCELCLGEQKHEHPSICLDHGACVKRTGRIEPIVLIEKLNAKLNGSRRRAGLPPIPVRHHLMNPRINRD